jgi:two-component system OmpR family sensor kinase
MKARSLRRDLTLGLGLGLTVLWIVAMLGAWLIVREEMDEVYDSLMEETAHRLLPIAVPRDKTDPPAQAEALLTWVLRDLSGAIIMRSGERNDDVFAVIPAEGFSTIGDFRHFVRTDDSRSLDVASPMQERREAAQEILLALLVPGLALLPLSLVGIAWFTRRKFRSILALSAEVSGRQSNDLHPLATSDLQAELLPIRDAVNRLMGTLNEALDAERAFSANAAHELRTPIAATLAHVQRLVAETSSGPAHDRARMVEAELKRVTRVVEKLLQLARAENASDAPAQTVDAVQVLQLVAGDFGAALQAPDAPLWVRLDADALAILARNLIENAVLHGRNVRVSLSNDGWLRILNEGSVVLPDTLPLLTRRFERGTSRQQGSGLGLAIVSAIVRDNELPLALYSPARGQEDGFEACVRLPVERVNEMPRHYPCQ